MSILLATFLLPVIALLGVTLWNALCWPRVMADGRQQQQAQARTSVSILIPARDEETNLALCLEHALAQTSDVVREILIYDDHSTDDTARIIAGYARRDARVRGVASSKLPAGWCGKTFACARLAAEARGDWLLFLDADARLSASAASHIVAEAETREVTFLSCWPALELVGFWERALMPLLNFVVFTLYPAPLAFKRPLDASLGLAHGSCILTRRDVYEQTGGHALVRAEIFEDVRLAQSWRACGERSLCLDGQDVLSVRMYSSFKEIWRGFQKNFFPAFRRERSFWMFILLHFTLCLLPFILLPFAVTNMHAGASLLIFTLALCVLAMRAVLAWRFGHPWWSVLLHPLGEMILLALGISSWWKCKTGRGVEWKGRHYHADDHARAELSKEELTRATE